MCLYGVYEVCERLYDAYGVGVCVCVCMERMECALVRVSAWRPEAAQCRTPRRDCLRRRGSGAEVER